MKGTLRPVPAVPARVGFIQKSYMMWNLPKQYTPALIRSRVNCKEMVRVGILFYLMNEDNAAKGL